MITPEQIAGAADAAMARTAPHLRRTPLELLSRPGRRPVVAAKCENFQVTGSFKARGALNAITIAAERGIRRVVAASTGNHGAAVAYAGHTLGVEVTVYVPETADPTKLDTIRRWGAAIERVPGDPVNAERAGREAASDATPYISPYNHPDVVAGQGTIGVELLEQATACDTVVVAVGGGGLVSGIASVMKAGRPDLRVVGVSPANSAVMLESVARGEVLDLESAPTVSDGTAGGVEAGTLTFPLCRMLVDDWLTVTEEEITQAMAGYIAAHHQLIEGAAAVALAGAAKLGAYEGATGNTVIVLCGANVSVTTLRTVLDAS